MRGKEKVLDAEYTDMESEEITCGNILMDERAKNQVSRHKKNSGERKKPFRIVSLPEGRHFNTKKEHQTQGAKGAWAVMTVGLRDTYASHDLKQHSHLSSLKSASLCLE